MRLDASLGFEVSLTEVPDVARRAEAVGVAGLWSADVSHDPFLPLVLAAEHSERLEAFAVVSAPAGARAAMEHRADGLIDRVAPYATFGTGAWAALSP